MMFMSLIRVKRAWGKPVNLQKSYKIQICQREQANLNPGLYNDIDLGFLAAAPRNEDHALGGSAVQNALAALTFQR